MINNDKISLRDNIGVMRPNLLQVLVVVELFVAFNIFMFALVGYSIGAATSPLFLLAAVQALIAFPGYYYCLRIVPKYLVLHIVLQASTLLAEVVWLVILIMEKNDLPYHTSASVFLGALVLLQISNLVVACIYRDVHIKLTCCNKITAAGRARDPASEVEAGKSKIPTAPPSWATTNNTSKSVSPDVNKSSCENFGKSAESMKSVKANTHSSMSTRSQAGKEADSPLEKNLFANCTEEDRQRAMGKIIDRLAVETAQNIESPSDGEKSEDTEEATDTPLGQDYYPNEACDTNPAEENSETPMAEISRSADE